MSNKIGWVSKYRLIMAKAKVEDLRKQLKGQVMELRIRKCAMTKLGNQNAALRRRVALLEGIMEETDKLKFSPVQPKAVLTKIRELRERL